MVGQEKMDVNCNMVRYKEMYFIFHHDQAGLQRFLNLCPRWCSKFSYTQLQATSPRRPCWKQELTSWIPRGPFCLEVCSNTTSGAIWVFQPFCLLWRFTRASSLTWRRTCVKCVENWCLWNLEHNPLNIWVDQLSFISSGRMAQKRQQVLV